MVSELCEAYHGMGKEGSLNQLVRGCLDQVWEGEDDVLQIKGTLYGF